MMISFVKSKRSDLRDNPPHVAVLAISVNQNHHPRHPASFAEGRIAVVTRREAGMRWTRMDLLTSGPEADGEIVWFWRPKGLALSRDDAQRITPATVANDKVHREERV
jgi:hypothetical protein